MSVSSSVLTGAVCSGRYDDMLTRPVAVLLKCFNSNEFVTSGDPVGYARELLASLGRFLFRYRNGGFPIVFLTLSIGFRPVQSQGYVFGGWTLDLIGFAMALVGQALRVLVIGFAYIKRGGKNKQIYANELVQNGIFAHCRNPLYVGNILILTGLMVIHNSPWMYLFGLPFFVIAYFSIVLAEEQFLLGKFGKTYQDYCCKVNRFRPTFHDMGKMVVSMRFDWLKVVRKEYGTTFTWLTCVIALLILDRWTNSTYRANVHDLKVIALLWPPFFLAYLTARMLKKKRLLGTD